MEFDAYLIRSVHLLMELSKEFEQVFNLKPIQQNGGYNQAFRARIRIQNH